MPGKVKTIECDICKAKIDQRETYLVTSGPKVSFQCGACVKLLRNIKKRFDSFWQ